MELQPATVSRTLSPSLSLDRKTELMVTIGVSDTQPGGLQLQQGMMGCEEAGVS